MVRPAMPPCQNQVDDQESRAPHGITEWARVAHRAVAAKTHPRFTNTTDRIITVLARYGDWRDGTNIRPSRARIAAEARCSERAVTYHLGYLVAAGLLHRVALGTRLPGGICLASEYAAVIPASLRPDADRQRARELAVSPRRIAARHITAPGHIVRAERARAAGAGPAVVSGRCAPPRGTSRTTTHSLHGFRPAQEIDHGVRQATNLACHLRQTYRQFAECPAPQLATILAPAGRAGWTTDDLDVWLGRAPLPGWYRKHTDWPRWADPMTLPPAEGVRRPQGLLAYRMRDAVAAWTPIAQVRAEVSAAARDRAETIRTDVDRALDTMDIPADLSPRMRERLQRRGIITA